MSSQSMPSMQSMQSMQSKQSMQSMQSKQSMQSMPSMPSMPSRVEVHVKAFLPVSDCSLRKDVQTSSNLDEICQKTQPNAMWDAVDRAMLGGNLNCDLMRLPAFSRRSTVMIVDNTVIIDPCLFVALAWRPTPPGLTLLLLPILMTGQWWTW